MFIDGHHAASVLRSKYPEDFQVLSSTPVAFHYINDGHHLHYAHPTIELANSAPSPTSQERAINYINYSPPFQAPLHLWTTPPTFYPALSRFTALLNDPENTYEYTLQEGDAVIFDNRRVLHARTAFRDKDSNESGAEFGDTNRWLKGCYLEADAVLDRGRVLKTKAEQGLL